GNIFTLEFILSFSGSVSAAILMLIFKKMGDKKISIKGVSIIGGITHNLVQFVVIYIMTLNKLLLFYLPLLLFFGGVSGFIIGLITQFLINRVKKFEDEEKLTPW
ncbi:MAG TPA: heptaprenyl diphosphate synthase, partial [Firmicutes bacterium]|nr:heptaprenyl diphosphate synthase [Bacillota bacterium]